MAEAAAGRLDTVFGRDKVRPLNDKYSSPFLVGSLELH